MGGLRAGSGRALPPGAPVSLLGDSATASGAPTAAPHPTVDPPVPNSNSYGAVAPTPRHGPATVSAASMSPARQAGAPPPTASTSAGTSAYLAHTNEPLPALQAPSSLGLVPRTASAAAVLGMLSGPLSFQSGVSGHSSAGPASPSLASLQALRLKQAATAMQASPNAPASMESGQPGGTSDPGLAGAAGSDNTATSAAASVKTQTVGVVSSMQTSAAEDDFDLEAEALAALDGLAAEGALGQEPPLNPPPALAGLLLGPHSSTVTHVGGQPAPLVQQQHPEARLRKEGEAAAAAKAQRQQANSDFVGSLDDNELDDLSDDSDGGVVGGTDGQGGGHSHSRGGGRRGKRVRMAHTACVPRSGEEASSVLGGGIMPLQVPAEVTAALQLEVLCACAVQRRVVSKGRFQITLQAGVARIGGTELLAHTAKFALDFSE